MPSAAAVLPQTKAASPAAPEAHHRGGLLALSVGALGVVFGDIGTSPLYTLQECFGPHGVDAAKPENVLGVLSLFFWSLTLVVSLKYVWILMRADNRGEGGIMALLALVPARQRQVVGTQLGWVTLLVIAGSALLFGDGVITPAISVLSAVEGLKLVHPAFQHGVVIITVVILCLLFSLQRQGTGGLGKLFGPIMVAWFVVIGLLGTSQICQHPSVLWAVWPGHALNFFAVQGFHGFALLGSVVLCVTGGEALYADMGHFGRGPIRLAWGTLVFPALLLCYFGQGALLLGDATRAQAPFFSLLDSPTARIPLVLLATAATVIASQGLISAVFSLTHQAVRLGYFPRVLVQHTSSEVEGQIYVPAMNWLLALACIGLVLFFQESTRLAAAFGLAVSGTMAITSVIFFSVTRNTWEWPLWKSLSLLLLFLSFDLPFFGATCLKFMEGGYIPFCIGASLYVVMVTWSMGRSLLRDYYRSRQLTQGQLQQLLKEQPPVRLPGLGVYLNSSPDLAPPVLLIQLKKFRGISQEILFLSVTSESQPYVAEDSRVVASVVEDCYYRVVARYGFMEMPCIPEVMNRAAQQLPLRTPPSEATYFVGRENFVGHTGHMAHWREKLFAALARNAADITHYFELPPEQVVEIGNRVEL